MKGRLTLALRDAGGREVERRVVDNLITDAGRALVARFVTGDLQGTPTLFIAVGTGTKDADEKDKELVKKVARAKADVQVTGSVATIKATLGTTGTDTVEPLAEAGIEVEVSGAPPVLVLYNRATFAVINKSPSMEMTMSWEVTF